MDITEVTLIHHVGIVLAVLWFLSQYNCCHAIAYFISLIYLFVVHERYVMRLRRKLQFEEKKQGNQRRVLSDSETVRWLNHAVEKIWPICIEQIASQRVLLPIIPWFLEKYKPWTVSKGVLQHLYLGRNPPMFTEMRVLRQSTDDDHLVLELGMNFLTADDMLGILAVKLKKRLGFGIWAKLHITGMHVEGKVMIGVKFLHKWPFLSRVRICFVEPPYFQMTVKPIFTRGLDVTEVPGIDGWLDKLLSIAFEQTLVQVFRKLVAIGLKNTLVQPNMLVVDVEKFISPEQESWFSVDEKDPVAHVKVEVIEASDMKVSDLNGFADPYVKGQFGVYQFKTKIQKKTLSPKWFEEFKIPVITWDSPNVLFIEVHDKDIFVDDTLGNCSIKISDLRDGVRHDMWLPLRSIKTAGRVHVAITVLENNGKSSEFPDVGGKKMPNMEDRRDSFSSETANKNSFSSVSSEKSPRVADNYEPIDVEGQKETGIWVHHPGSEVSQTWEARKGKDRRLNTQIQGEPNGSGGTDQDDKRSMQSVRQSLRKLGSVFQRTPKKVDAPSSFTESIQSPVTPRVNLRAVNEKDKDTGVRFVVEDGKVVKEGDLTSGSSSAGSPEKAKVKGKAKNFFKNAERSVKHALSRKGSRKSVSDREILGDSNSSEDDESLPSPFVKVIPVASRDILRPAGYESVKSDEPLAQPDANVQSLASFLSGIAEDVELPEKKGELEDTQEMHDDMPDNPERNNEGSSDPLKVEAR